MAEQAPEVQGGAPPLAVSRRTLRLPQVLEMTALSRTTIWRMERKGTFPARLRLGEASVGWDEAEIVAWLTSRPRGMAAAASRPAV